MTAKGLICSPCILFVYQEDRVISWVEEKWSMTDRAMETSFSCAPQIAFRSMHNSPHIPLPKGMSKTPGNLTPCSEYSRKNGMKICLLMYDLTKLKKKCSSLKGFEGISKVYKQYWNHCLSNCMVGSRSWGSKAGTKHDAPSTMFHSYKVLVCSDEFLLEWIFVSHVSTTQCLGSALIETCLNTFSETFVVPLHLSIKTFRLDCAGWPFLMVMNSSLSSWTLRSL